MNKPLLAAGALLLGGIVTGGAILVASSSGEEEAVQVQESRSRSASITLGGSPSPTASVTPTPVAPLSPLSPVNVPADWLTYTDPKGLYSFRYPSGWHIETGGRRSVILTSWDAATWQSAQFPPGSTKVDVIVATLDQAEGRPDGASTSTILAGAAGWEIVYSYDASAKGGVTGAHEIAADYGSYRYFVTGLFAQEQPDEGTLLAIVASFSFGT